MEKGKERKKRIELESKVIIRCLTPGIKINLFKYWQRWFIRKNTFHLILQSISNLSFKRWNIIWNECWFKQKLLRECVSSLKAWLRWMVRGRQKICQKGFHKGKAKGLFKVNHKGNCFWACAKINASPSTYFTVAILMMPL